jgi:hypothetical protein
MLAIVAAGPVRVRLSPDPCGRETAMTAVAVGRRIGPWPPNAATSAQLVYDFADGSRGQRALLAGNGAGIAEMTHVLGADLVPAGFTITTEARVAYMQNGRTARSRSTPSATPTRCASSRAGSSGCTSSRRIRASSCGRRSSPSSTPGRAPARSRTGPESIHFFHAVGLHYVSCSPFRMPIARVAAAQGRSAPRGDGRGGGAAAPAGRRRA